MLKVVSLVPPNGLRSGCGKLIAQVGFVEGTKANLRLAEGLKAFDEPGPVADAADDE